MWSSEVEFISLIQLTLFWYNWWIPSENPVSRQRIAQSRPMTILRFWIWIFDCFYCLSSTKGIQIWIYRWIGDFHFLVFVSRLCSGDCSPISFDIRLYMQQHHHVDYSLSTVNTPIYSFSDSKPMTKRSGILKKKKKHLTSWRLHENTHLDAVFTAIFSNHATTIATNGIKKSIVCKDTRKTALTIHT